MKALLYGVKPEPQPEPTGDDADNPLLRGLAHTPMRLVDRDDPGFLRPDWVVTRPRLTGICGSDAKQVFMDWGNVGGADNPMKAFFSLPQVLGHEGRGGRRRARARGRGARRRRPRRAEPVAVVRAARRRADVRGVPNRGLQPVRQLRRRPDRAGHSHRHVERRQRRVRRAHAGARLAAVQGSRQRVRRAGRVRRSVRGELARDHAPSSEPRWQGDGVRRRRARHVRDGDLARVVSRRRSARRGALRRTSRPRPLARRDRHRSHAGAAGHRRGGGVVGRCAPGQRRPADGVPRRDRRRLRHRRQAGDVRGWPPGCSRRGARS